MVIAFCVLLELQNLKDSLPMQPPEMYCLIFYGESCSLTRIVYVVWYGSNFILFH